MIHKETTIRDRQPRWWLLLSFLMAASITVHAQSEYFVYEDEGETIITGLANTIEASRAKKLTIPAKVTTVKSGALTYASTSLTDLIIEDGGNPAFETALFGSSTNTLTTINMGNAMTVANMAALLKSVEAFNEGTTIEAWGFSGEKDTGSSVWSGVTWDNVASITLPAELIGDQAFGSAKVFGRFYINKELISFCTSATFLDSSGSNMLFYVADSREADGRLHIQRVRYIAKGKGVLIHKTENSSGYADLERTESINDAAANIEQAKTDLAFYNSNMLVGVTEATSIGKTEVKDNVTYTNYVLKDGAFYPTSGGTIKANRAYLQLPASATAHDGLLDISFDEVTTGIRTANSTNSDAIYDLQGRYVGRLTDSSLFIFHPSHNKGLYIKNGKKYVVR